MKKSTIVSIVLALMLVANASAAKKGPEEMTKKKVSLKNNFKRGLTKRDTCDVITCVSEGGQCDDDTLICMNDIECNGYVCAKPKVGSKCEGYNDCHDDDIDTLYCEESENKCQLRKGKEAKCSYGNSYECKDDYYCNATTESTTGVCIPKPTKAGDPCTGSGQCPYGMICNKNACVNYPSTAGGACVQEVGCNNKELYCDKDTNKCKKYPKKGEECYNGQCAEDLYCNASNKCSDYPDEGEPCYNNYYCNSGLYCNESFVCVTYPSEGEECHQGRCAGGFYCGSENMCNPLPGLGENCTDKYGCKDGLSCVVKYNVYKCYEYVGIGKDCSGNYKSCNYGSLCDPETSKCVYGECSNDLDCK